MATVDEGTPLWGLSADGGISGSSVSLPGQDPMQIISRALTLLGPQQSPRPKMGNMILGGLGDALTAAAAGYERRPMTGPGPFASSMEQRQREYAQGQAAARAHIIGSVLGQVLKPKKSPIYKTNDQGVIGAIDQDTHEFTPVTDESGNPVKAMQPQKKLGHEMFIQGGRQIARFYEPSTGKEISRQDLGPADQNVTWQWNDAKQSYEALPTKIPGAPSAAPTQGGGEATGPSGGSVGPLATISAPGAKKEKTDPNADMGPRIDMARFQVNKMQQHFDDAVKRGRGGLGLPAGLLARNDITAPAAGWMGQVGEDARIHEANRHTVAVTLAPVLSGSKRAVVQVQKAIEQILPSFLDNQTAADELYSNVHQLLDLAGSLPGTTPEQRARARSVLRSGIMNMTSDPVKQAGLNSAFAEADSSLDSGETTAGQIVAKPADIAKRRAALQSRLQTETNPDMKATIQGALDELDKQTAAVNAAGGMSKQGFASGHVMPKVNFDKLSPENQQRWLDNGGTVR